MYSSLQARRTLVVEQDAEMITLFHLFSALVYYDENDNPAGHDDVHTKIEMCRQPFWAGWLGR